MFIKNIISFILVFSCNVSLLFASPLSLERESLLNKYSPIENEVVMRSFLESLNTDYLALRLLIGEPLAEISEEVKQRAHYIKQNHSEYQKIYNLIKAPAEFARQSLELQKSLIWQIENKPWYKKTVSQIKPLQLELAQSYANTIEAIPYELLEILGHKAILNAKLSKPQQYIDDNHRKNVKRIKDILSAHVATIPIYLAAAIPQFIFERNELLNMYAIAHGSVFFAHLIGILIEYKLPPKTHDPLQTTKYDEIYRGIINLLYKVENKITSMRSCDRSLDVK